MDQLRDGPPARHSISADAFALILSFTRWPLAARLMAAVVAVILGAGFRHIFLGVLEGRLIYITFFPAVAAAAVVGGVSGGVLATLLSAAAAHVSMAPLRAAADIAGLGRLFRQQRHHRRDRSIVADRLAKAGRRAPLASERNAT